MIPCSAKLVLPWPRAALGQLGEALGGVRHHAGEVDLDALEIDEQGLRRGR